MPDDDHGVPFPGEVLPGSLWTRTGLPRGLAGPFDWDGIFGRSGPRVLDLGCGNGRYLIGSSLARPDRDHLGVDLLQPAVDHGAHRANKRGLTNVRFAVGEASDWLFRRLDADTVDEIHIYHPQPHYEAEGASRRLLTPEFLARAWEVLRPGGLLVLQTDNKAYWDYLRKSVPFLFEPRLHKAPWEDAPLGRTRREIYARQTGLAVFRMEAVRRETPQGGEMPRPDFNADRPRFRRGGSGRVESPP